MKIALFTDLRFSAHASPTGVGKHIIQMANGLAQSPGMKLGLVATSDQLDGAGLVPSENALSKFSARRIPLPWKAAEALWTVSGHPAADRWIGEPDWVYCPKNDYIPVRRTRLAVTVHGAHELDPHFPQSQSVSARLNRIRRRTSYNRMLHAASLVLTVSEFLKAQIVDWFKVAPEKIVVVGNGVEPAFYKIAGQPCGGSGESVEQSFVLAVGGLNFLDGGDRILKLASHFKKRFPDLRVLVAGGQHEPALLRMAAELPNIKLLGYVPADRLALYMHDALALLYPTRYETFGIAAAEAMAAGTPVVTCRSTAVPEVVGEAGIYTDPDKPESMVDALMDIESQPGLRNRLVIRGYQQAKKFTWSACVTRLEQALVKSNG